MGNAVASLIGGGCWTEDARRQEAAAVDAKGVTAIGAADGKDKGEARTLGVLAATATSADEVDGQVSMVHMAQMMIAVERNNDAEEAEWLGEESEAEAPVAAYAEPVIALDAEGEAPAREIPVAAAAAAVKTPVVEVVQAIAVEEMKAAPVKWLKHYSSAQSILLVGDGDFSFSRALAAAFGSGKNLVATSLDSYEALEYYYSEAVSNIMELERMGAIVLHDADATTMERHPGLKMRRFDRIVFNFPHAGLHGRERGVIMISTHKELMRGFFDNARHLLHPNGEIHISHKTGQPYDRWDIERLASEASLVMIKKIGFQKEDYPGYNAKRGHGAKRNKPLKSGACCTFKFRIRDLEEDESE